MRLIDANNAISVLKIISDKCYDNNAFKQAISVLESVPTIDAVEVKHGEWIAVKDWLQIPQEDSGTYRCSACGQVMKYPWNYCPNCGAKMDGKENRNDQP